MDDLYVSYQYVCHVFDAYCIVAMPSMSERNTRVHFRRESSWWSSCSQKTKDRRGAEEADAAILSITVYVLYAS